MNINIIIKNHVFIIIFISVSFHLLSSIFSLGWYNTDEQSCVLEYLNSKLGFESNRCFFNYSKENLILIQKIRSWFQPFFYFIIAKTTFFIHNNEAFLLTIIIKLFSSFIGFLSIYYFYNITKNHFKQSISQKIYFLLTFLFWFYPFLHARTSQENLSISFLFLSIALYFQIKDKFKLSTYLVLGLLLSLTFFLRYNLGISLLFLVIWDFLYSKKTLKLKILSYCIFIIVGLVLLIIELLVNIWGYDVPLNNISEILKSITSINFLFYGNFNNNMSQEPIYWYFEKILLDFLPPTSLIVLISLIFFWIKSFKTEITFLTLPFFVVHCFIGHKELRYIFPVLAFAPYFITYILDKYYNLFLNNKILFRSLYFLFAINIIGLIFISLTPLQSELKILKKIYNNNDIKKIFFVNDRDNIKRYESLNPFYLKNVTINYYFKFKSIELYLEETKKSDKLIYRGFCRAGYSIGDCVKEEQKNIISNKLYYLLNFANQNKELKIKLRNIENFNLTEYEKLRSESKSNKIYILSKDYKTINQIKKIKNCEIIYNNIPSFMSNMNFNNINKRLSFYFLFDCK